MTELAKAMGGVLYDAAREENAQAEVLADLQTAAELLQAQPQYARLLNSPVLRLEERTALVDESFGGRVHPYVVNFIKVLAERRMATQLGTCCEAYTARYCTGANIARVSAVSAVDLSEAQLAALKAKLAEATGKTIWLTAKTDPAVVGGIRIDMDGTRLDGTVKERLDTLRAKIGELVL